MKRVPGNLGRGAYLVPENDSDRAVLAVQAAAIKLREAVEACERAGFGGHVMEPLREALASTRYCVGELQ